LGGEGGEEDEGEGAHEGDCNPGLQPGNGKDTM